MTKKIVVGISGATGAIFGIRLLDHLRTIEDIESHLIISAWGTRTIKHETDYSVEDVKSLADVAYSPGDLGATISSGSFKTEGMVIAPCSVKTLAGIATGWSDNLLCRAADVILKERRKLVLMVRESPFSLLHLENMVTLARMGCVIAPPLPAFYNHPGSIDDIVDHVVARCLDQFDLASGYERRWHGRLER